MHELGDSFGAVILQATGASSLEVEELIQELWSGYGRILRVRLTGDAEVPETVVVKHVRLPSAASHPRGWNSSRSHDRKVRSYEVETCWYRDYSSCCNDRCRVPRMLAFDRQGDEVLMVLEDLDASGYPERLSRVEWCQVEVCLRWLANFHAAFLGKKPDGLWEVGTYWHLDTRPDELEVLEDRDLKAAANAIDAQLSSATWQTLVHGDAKLANFCFSGDGMKVAAVDFQYVGGGCGMKDVAYFVGSCLDERECEDREAEILECYFSALLRALETRGRNDRLAPSANEIDGDALTAEWRALYPLAWTDFHRFLKGWSPGHWKINSYSERLAREAVAGLANSS